MDQGYEICGHQTDVNDNARDDEVADERECRRISDYRMAAVEEGRRARSGRAQVQQFGKQKPYSITSAGHSEFPGGATWIPRKPPRSIASFTKPDALASSMNPLI